MGLLHNKNYGYLQTFKLEAITSGSSLQLPIDDTIKEQLEYFNVVDIINNSDEDIEVQINGSENAYIYVKSGTNKAVTGTEFKDLIIKNTAGTDTSADEIIISIQKELGFKEHVILLDQVLRQQMD